MSFGGEKENNKIQESVEVNEVKKLSFEMIFPKLMTHAFKTASNPNENWGEKKS